MDLRVGHDIDVWLDQACTLALADPGGRGSDDSFGTGHVHRLEEEPGKLANEPLHRSSLFLVNVISLRLITLDSRSRAFGQRQ
jgi:hypothetical protein